MNRHPANSRGLKMGSIGCGAWVRPFLEESVAVQVRFQEVDTLRIVWHGHYVAYLEDGRRAFGRRYGVDYPLFRERGVAIPVVHLAMDYLAPALMDDVLTVTARLLKTDCARLDFDYEVRRATDGVLLARAETRQAFTTPQGELLLGWPDFMEERLKSWEAQWRPPLSERP
ncbi:MAG: acyl-CoA thioesterase [Verrucomicrobiales bacterium]|nr:acyl-CoA thioesterase [Verrucomicrobiales bacterium]